MGGIKERSTPKEGVTVIVDGKYHEVISAVPGVGFMVGYPRRIILLDETFVEWETVEQQLEND